MRMQRKQWQPHMQRQQPHIAVITAYRAAYALRVLAWSTIAALMVAAMAKAMLGSTRRPLGVATMRMKPTAPFGLATAIHVGRQRIGQEQSRFLNDCIAALEDHGRTTGGSYLLSLSEECDDDLQRILQNVQNVTLHLTP